MEATCVKIDGRHAASIPYAALPIKSMQNIRIETLLVEKFGYQCKRFEEVRKWYSIAAVQR